jgi:CheY-like chemotaxis protein
VIADDDVQVQAVVRAALQGLGVESRSASSGSEALRLAVLDVRYAS